MGVQSLCTASGALRLARALADGTFALVWLAALFAFALRPSLNQYSAYSRFAARAGLVIVGFSFVYGAIASWFNEGYYLFAALAVIGFVLARIPGRVRLSLELGEALALMLIGGYARGWRLEFVGAVQILLPLSFAESAARTVQRVRLEGEISLQDIRKRNEELEELAYRDSLTRLYNRRFGFESLSKAISFTRRYGGDLHVLVLDIDHFKRVNDELGHPVGDGVLVRLAEILVSSLRDTDVAARIGGEEFLVILPRARPEHAQIIANRIRGNTAAAAFEDVPWDVTVSIGVTSLRKEDTAETLFSRADAFLYESKRGGRNRVTGS